MENEVTAAQNAFTNIDYLLDLAKEEYSEFAKVDLTEAKYIAEHFNFSQHAKFCELALKQLGA